MGSFNQRLQVGDSLGDRMVNAFEESFEEGCSKVLMIGTDCYDITPAIISAHLGLDEE